VSATGSFLAGVAGAVARDAPAAFLVTMKPPCHAFAGAGCKQAAPCSQLFCNYFVIIYSHYAFFHDIWQISDKSKLGEWRIER
jgi:hypothetical protein